MTDTPPRPALAYHLTVGKGPPVVFLPGYASDMSGSKAVALEDWANAVGRTYLRFDYGGCGASEGDFADQTLNGWSVSTSATLPVVAPDLHMKMSLRCGRSF